MSAAPSKKRKPPVNDAIHPDVQATIRILLRRFHDPESGVQVDMRNEGFTEDSSGLMEKLLAFFSHMVHHNAVDPDRLKEIEDLMLNYSSEEEENSSSDSDEEEEEEASPRPHRQTKK